jgi:hypothetical protein
MMQNLTDPPPMARPYDKGDCSILYRNAFSAITNLDNKKVITTFPLTNTISAEFFCGSS